MLILTAVAAGVVLRAQEPRPLPSQDALFKAVQENLIRAERVDYQYAFRERRTDIHTNPFGKLGTGGIHGGRGLSIGDGGAHVSPGDRDATACR